jgi:hypothetical protein
MVFLTVSYCDICPLPDGRHLAVGCLARLAQVGAARRHLRAEPCLPQLNLQHKSRLIQLSKERRKFEQIRESDFFLASSFTHGQYYGTGFIEAGSRLFSESDPDTDPGFYEQKFEHFFFHKKQHFFF